MFPFDNQVYCFELTWEELLSVLEYAMTANGRALFSEVSGIICYYTEDQVNAILTPGGLVIYVNGAWRNGWKDRKLTVSASEFVVTTDRPDGGLSNPLYTWLDTERLLAFDKVDNVSAIEVLEEEAAAHDGYLAIDTAPHFVSASYEIAGGSGVFILPDGIREIGPGAFEGAAVQVLVVPEGCTAIQAGAFRDCTSLREVWLPMNCDVDAGAFSGCTSLTAVFAPAGGTSEAFADG